MSGHIPAAAYKVNQHGIVADAHRDDHFSPGSGILRLLSHTGPSGTWWTGEFVDYRGIVSIQMEDGYLRIDAVADGHCHARSWDRGFGDRTVAKLCRAFLTDLHGAPLEPVS